MSDTFLQNVLDDGRRLRHANALSASLAFGWRALLRIKHVPEQLFDVTLFPIMFTVMFTYLFGGALAGSTHDYLQFLLPGIMVQTILMITIYTGITMTNDIKKGVFDRFRSLPIWQPAIIVGPLLGDFVRYSLASAIMYALGALMGFRPGGGVAGVLLGILLLQVFAFSVSWIWTALSMVMRSQESLMGVSMFLLFPLTFASNIFVDPQTMPGWLQAFVAVNPVTLLTTAVRSLMHGEATLGQFGTVFAIAAALVALFGPLTMVLFRRRQ